MWLSEPYRCLFKCKQENCLKCSSPYCSLRLKGCIFFRTFSFQKTFWRKPANFCPHNFQVTSMEAEHTDLQASFGSLCEGCFFFFLFKRTTAKMISLNSSYTICSSLCPESARDIMWKIKQDLLFTHQVKQDTVCEPWDV